MSETRFIKAAAFCGYDKADVDKKIEVLSNLVYDLKNELRETKLVIKKYEEGTDAEKAYENALALERAQITHLQVKNSNISEKNKAFTEEMKAKEQEIAELKSKVEELTAAKENLELELQSAKSQNIGETMGVIFMEAQKSRDMIINDAKARADECETACKKFVEEYIADANNNAADIIYQAEKQAAEIIAEAKNSSEQMKVASENLKVVILDDVERFGTELAKAKALLADLEASGTKIIAEAEDVLKSTRNDINEGGAPVFRMPQNYTPEYPEPPVSQQPAAVEAENEEKQKRAAELDKLQAMADAIGGRRNADKSINLADLAAQAAAIGGGAPSVEKSEPEPKPEKEEAKPAKEEPKPEKVPEPAEEAKPEKEPPKEEPKPAQKKGAIGLSDLMKMANNLEN